jgi:hypothetical protein
VQTQLAESSCGVGVKEGGNEEGENRTVSIILAKFNTKGYKIEAPFDIWANNSNISKKMQGPTSASGLRCSSGVQLRGRNRTPSSATFHLRV